MGLGDNYKPASYDRVCGDHFQNGRRSEDIESPNSIPTLNLPKSKPPVIASNRKRRCYIDDEENNEQTPPKQPKSSDIPDHTYSRKRKFRSFIPVSSAAKKKLRMEKSRIEELQAQLSNTSISAIPHPITDPSHDYHSTKQSNSLADDMEELCNQLEDLGLHKLKGKADCIVEKIKDLESEIKELPHLRQMVEKLEKKTISLKLLENKRSCLQWTGLPNKEMFEALHKFLWYRLQHLNMWRGEAWFDAERCLTISPKRNERVLTTKEELLLTLVRLKTGMSVNCLAHLMGYLPKQSVKSSLPTLSSWPKI